MKQVGERIHARAQELGLSDSELARRLGLSQSRVANYVSGKRAPDYGTLLRICAVLQVTPNDLLGVGQPHAPLTEADRIRTRIASAIIEMEESNLQTALTVVDALIARTYNR